MTKVIPFTNRSAEVRSMLPQFSRAFLTRRFVETGDDRCPIAGIWSRLEQDPTTDESELTWPAVGRLFLPRWAFLPLSQPSPV